MSTLRLDESDRVLHIALNRPDKRNAIDDQMFDELVDAAETARTNTDVAAIVVSGEGKSLCAGLDFAVHQTFAGEGAAGQRPYADPDDPTSTGRVPGRGQRIVGAFRGATIPVIAALHGHAIGGGLQIALGADIRIVTPDVQLGCAEIEFGMTVDVRASQLLPRLIGADPAIDLLVTGRRISGAQAVAWVWPSGSVPAWNVQMLAVTEQAGEHVRELAVAECRPFERRHLEGVAGVGGLPQFDVLLERGLAGVQHDWLTGVLHVLPEWIELRQRRGTPALVGP